jgi:ectoine hydroxylase-related dioxygenase (phytanoyl-CoA dioxygenase family)
MMKLSPNELKQNKLKPETLTAAVQQVKVNGYVVFESVLSPDFVQTLHDEYMAIYDEALETPPEKTFAKNHFRLFLPFRPPFNDESIITNPFALPVMESLIGVDLVCHYFASNTCAPGSEFQPVHSDTFNLFPESNFSPPPFMLVLNIPLVNTTEENGPMQIWPGGSHLSSVPHEDMLRLAEHLPSQPALMPAGSIMVRDGRMWHRGTQNRSDQPRPNIAIVYTRPWLGAGLKRIGIPQVTFDNLSPRAQEIFKHENVGGELDSAW